MPRPVMLGIVGDSGSGKTTITRGLVRVLGAEQVTHFCTDDYHSYDRKQRAERGITPLHPDGNHLDIRLRLEQAADALAHEIMVIREHNPYRHAPTLGRGSRLCSY